MTTQAWKDFVGQSEKTIEPDITCQTCGETKPAAHFHWRTNWNQTIRVRRVQCRVCVNKKQHKPGMRIRPA